MPKISSLDNIIASGMMQTSYRVLTTSIQWPSGDPPFPAGEYAHTENPIGDVTVSNQTAIQLPTAHFSGDDTQDYLKLESIDSVVVGDVESQWVMTGDTPTLPSNAIVDSIEIVAYCKGTVAADTVTFVLSNVEPTTATEYTDVQTASSSTYSFVHSTQYTVNPETLEPWVKADAISCAFGVKREAGNVNYDIVVDQVYKLITYHYDREMDYYDSSTFDADAWTNCTNIVTDYHITQDTSMQIDMASISVPLAWQESLASVWKEMRAVCIQERYSDGTTTTDWINVFWGISDGYSESWSGNTHNYVVNVKNALKLGNLDYLGTGVGTVVYQPDIIRVGTNTTHYDMELVNTAVDAFEFGICVTAGNPATAVHPNWADKPSAQFWCHNARDKDGNVSTEPIPLAVGGSSINAVFGEGIVRVGINWARTTSNVNGVTDYSAGLGLTALEIPDIRCVLFRFAHAETKEGISFRTPLTVASDVYTGLTVESSSAGQVVLSGNVKTSALTLMLQDGSGVRYRTSTTGTTTDTINLTNSTVVVPAGTSVNYGDANKLTTIIKRMLLDCGFQQADNTAPLYINTPEVPLIAGEAQDLIMPPLVYKDTDKVYPIEAIETLRQGGYIPPNYYVMADENGQIECKSVTQLTTGDGDIINITAIPAAPGVEYDRNDIDIKTRVVARGLVRQVSDHTQATGVTILDVASGDGGLPTAAFTLVGQVLRTGGDITEGNYQVDLIDLLTRTNNQPSIKGKDLKPWGWYYANSNTNNGLVNVVTLVNQWRNKYLAEITLAEPVNISAIELWTPCPWLTGEEDWGLGYHTTQIERSKGAHWDQQTIAVEYYDEYQETWLPLVNNIVCPISMKVEDYVKRIESDDFATREAVIAQKLRLLCIDPFFAEFGVTYHAVIGIFLSQIKIWGNTEIRGVAELGSTDNYNSELSASPWPDIRTRIRKRTHILDDAVPWITTQENADWLALEWLKQMVQDLAPRKLAVIRPDVRLWDTINFSAPGGVPIDYLVIATDHTANGLTSVTAVSYTYPYFDDNNDLPWFDTWSDTKRWNDSVDWKK